MRRFKQYFGNVLNYPEQHPIKTRKERKSLRIVLSIFAAVVVSSKALAADLEIPIVLLYQDEEKHIPLSLLKPVIDDTGQAGAVQGVEDNNTTGQFTGQSFKLRSVKAKRDESLTRLFKQQYAEGMRLFLLNLPADEILRIADLPEAQESLLFNIGAKEDRLRTQQCRPNLLHTVPSRAMLADALAQYLGWKRWNKWFLVVGRHAEDQLLASAFKRAAKRFGHKLVEEKAWTFDPGARRTDSGHTREQQAVNAFTQVDDYDILIVSDERDEFGEFLSYRTYLPRPVGGTQGLTPSAWSDVHEQWGATQFQRRFHEHNGRWMTDRDYAAWLAVRTIGEATTRIADKQSDKLKQYILSDEFKLAAFKGQPLSYRDWNGQLRQPLLVGSERVTVSVSPQAGYLHQFSALDTLGYDRPESRCVNLQAK